MFTLRVFGGELINWLIYCISSIRTPSQKVLTGRNNWSCDSVREGPGCIGLTFQLWDSSFVMIPPLFSSRFHRSLVICMRWSGTPWSPPNAACEPIRPVSFKPIVSWSEFLQEPNMM